MILRCVAIPAAVLMLAGCDSSIGSSNEKDVSIRAAAAESQKGRWQFVDAKPPYPALIFDSATGCVQTLEFIRDGERAGQLAMYGIYGADAICKTSLDLADLERRIETK